MMPYRILLAVGANIIILYTLVSEHIHGIEILVRLIAGISFLAIGVILEIVAKSEEKNTSSKGARL